MGWHLWQCKPIPSQLHYGVLEFSEWVQYVLVANIIILDL